MRMFDSGLVCLPLDMHRKTARLKDTKIEYAYDGGKSR